MSLFCIDSTTSDLKASSRPQMKDAPTAVSDMTMRSSSPAASRCLSDVSTTSSAMSTERKNADYSKNIKMELLDRWDSFLQSLSKSKSSGARFGEEVAEGLEYISNDYAREKLKRQIRDVLFHARFGSRI